MREIPFEKENLQIFEGFLFQKGFLSYLLLMFNHFIYSFSFVQFQRQAIRVKEKSHFLFGVAV